MHAGVVEDVQPAAAVAVEDQRLAAHLARDELPRLRDLGFVAEVQPAALENAAALEVEHLRVDESAAVDAKHAARLVVGDRPVHRVETRLLIHARSCIIGPSKNW